MLSTRPYQLEACVISAEQAVWAQSHGADRIELCILLETEGMTPSPELVEEVLNTVQVPVRVMVRETESGYEADDAVLEKMLHAIGQLKSFPLDGFVFGVLRQGRLDRDVMLRLLDHAAPFPVTVHKALDLSVALEEDLVWLNDFNQVDTILSSGGAVHAIDGAGALRRMQSIFRGDVMGAGKITPEVLKQLHPVAGLRWYHGRAIL